ncbi:hypothetical protein GCM10023196_092140 [Actinoallomurus vinaceus]|uniref:Uncharacterized protein n=1 Tax=Actinoallomurus vinaceus TaxID=1080074 RepID=A0ABP8UT71_9ACTN
MLTPARSASSPIRTGSSLIRGRQRRYALTPASMSRLRGGPGFRLPACRGGRTMCEMKRITAAGEYRVTATPEEADAC